MSPEEQATVIAQRLVNIAYKAGIGEQREAMIHETIVQELATSSTDPFRLVRALAVLQLLGGALIEIVDKSVLSEGGV